MPAVTPPVTPMLARLARELPVGPGWWYEPKWDGFRCLAFRDGRDVDLRSRHGRPLSRYFPEVVAAIMQVQGPGFVLDGEIIIPGADFGALMSRLHPAASRVARLAREIPASYRPFDLLALGDRDLCAEQFGRRRQRLKALLRGTALVPTQATQDASVAARWLDGGQQMVDGIIAKRADAPYEPGRRTMVKVKAERTADVVVAGFRPVLDGRGVASLLLGLYDDTRRLLHVGVVASLTAARRTEIETALEPYVTTLRGHPWEHGFALEGGHMGRLGGAAGRWTPDMAHDWVPVRPELVCEVAYDRVDGGRFRHAARFRRWRPDRDPRSCLIEQLAA